MVTVDPVPYFQVGVVVMPDSFATLETVTCQAPLSMGFSRQELWSGLPCSPPGDLPSPGTETASLISPALAGEFFTTSTSRKPRPFGLPHNTTLGTSFTSESWEWHLLE